MKFLNGKSLENILFFAAVASKFGIAIDNELDPSINIPLHDGTMIIFILYGAGLYYFDTTNEAFADDQNIEYTLLNTADSNKS